MTALIFSRNRFNKYITTVEVEGLKFDFHICDDFAKKYYAERETPRQPELAFMRDKMIAKGDIIFDVGANHGLHTIAYAIWTGKTGMVYSFEARQQNSRIIKKNIKLNKIDNAEVIGKAIGAAKKSIFINDYTNAHVITDRENNQIRTKMTPLDEFEGLKPDLLKIDVEGYEAEVLKGASRILSTLPKLSIEVHDSLLPKYNSSFPELLSFIDLREYQCWILQDRSKPPVPYNMEKTNVGRFHFFAIPNRKLAKKK